MLITSVLTCYLYNRDVPGLKKGQKVLKNIFSVKYYRTEIVAVLYSEYLLYSDIMGQLIKENILKYAKALDNAIEKRDVEEVISYFADNCEIELFGIKLSGREGLIKAVNWMFKYLNQITLIPITIMVDRNNFFEEFTVKAKVRGGKEIQVNQSEVLTYDNEYKVTSLRLYFDRLELASAYITNPVEKLMVNLINRASLKDLL